ncbi:hypothetical protein B0H14DRAFT_3852382 [Mycena olivaceomarginata]|nr:hypothetical protein B0H14DRAFT_3852382 [Mycena olivaceomarginata]
MLALVEFVRSETRTASAVSTPIDSGLPRNQTVTDQIMIRGRTGAGNPRPFLQTIVNGRLQLCAEPGEFLDAPVRPRSNTTIADIDPKFFILHKFVGDIVWMCGGPEPVIDNEEDEEEDMVVSDTNIGILLEKLRSPAMDLVQREQEVLFGSRMVLVQKDTVWV